jgi:hypothetical protein
MTKPSEIWSVHCMVDDVDELKTTQATHKMVLTQKQLIIVNQGGTVTQKASSHPFVIALAKRPDLRLRTMQIRSRDFRIFN